MKLLIALLLAMLAAGQNPTAQERLQTLKERLELTPEQVQQVQPILLEEGQKLKAIRDQRGSDPSRRDRRKMMREVRSIRDAADEKLQKILSKKQMSELKKIREESRERLREKAAERK